MYETFFCERLAQLRLEKGVSAREMSLSLGQSESYINRIENNQMLPSLTVFFYICDYFHITPKEFFENDSEIDLEYIELARNLKQLPEEERKHIALLVMDIIKLTSK
ncbi:helix-turn-helix transcriptional regulator [Massilistercora timonensis]|uniref:helix-turn-helix domain-containing protein n=1 Tax=Massilistercora timonensis TaxID=2086584 RepID=UPI003208C41F